MPNSWTELEKRDRGQDNHSYDTYDEFAREPVTSILTQRKIWPLVNHQLLDFAFRAIDPSKPKPASFDEVLSMS